MIEINGEFGCADTLDNEKELELFELELIQHDHPKTICYLNKEQAVKLINHLNEVFVLPPQPPLPPPMRQVREGSKPDKHQIIYRVGNKTTNIGFRRKEDADQYFKSAGSPGNGLKVFPEIIY